MNVYRMNHEGSQIEVITDVSLSDIQVYDNWLYGRKFSEGSDSLYRVNLVDFVLEVVSTEVNDSFYQIEDKLYIYFTNRNNPKESYLREYNEFKWSVVF